MSFVIQGEITLDAKGAVQGVKISKSQLDSLGKSGDAAAAQLDKAVKQVAGVGRNAGASTMQLANMQAQFNDIGVMLASGQNPLTLALQQGTQLNQVFAQMGSGRQVLRGIASGFMGMINPVSLATIGIIAGGAALVQWIGSASSAKDEAADLNDRLLEVRETMASLQEQARGLRLGQSPEELTLLDSINAKVEAVAEAERAVTEARNSRRFADELSARQQSLNLAQEALAAARQELIAFREVRAEVAARNSDMAEAVDEGEAYVDVMLDAKRATAENANIALLMRDGVRAATIQAIQMSGVDLSRPITPAVQRAAELATRLNITYAEALRAGDALDRIGQFSSGNTVAMINQITAALGVSTAQAIELARALPGYSDGGVSGPDGAVLQSRQFAGTAVPDVQIFNTPPPLAPTGGGVGGVGRGGARNDAATAAEQEQQALDDLLLSLQAELDLSRESDPVLREMIGYRDQLANATDEERAAVEDLIRTRLEEEATLERQRQGWEFWGQAAMTALDDVDGALEMVLKSLQQAALLGTGPLGALFGGTNDQGAGGLLGQAFSAFTGGIQKKASGGMIYGAGGGREDKQMTLTSPGEYIINAAATARNRPLLDAINYGPARMADGGVVGGMAAAPQLPSVGGLARADIHVHVHGAMADKDIEERARAGTAAAIAEYSDQVLPVRVREISENPEWIG